MFGKVLVDEICKKNKLFSCIFKDLYYSGSSGEGTQIGNASEFDLNFVLDMTKLKEEFHLRRYEGCPPGYALLEMKASNGETVINCNGCHGCHDGLAMPSPASVIEDEYSLKGRSSQGRRENSPNKPFQRTFSNHCFDVPFFHSEKQIHEDWKIECDVSSQINSKPPLPTFLENVGHNFVVSPEALRRWFRELVWSCTNRLDKSNNIHQHFERLDIERIFDVKNCGPAITLVIAMKSGKKIDVDLVPVLTFKPSLLKFYPEVWNNINQPKWLDLHKKEYKEKVLNSLEEHFNLVPKPLPEDDYAWRIDFHHVEKQILKESPVARKIVMLLKYFRNCNPPLHSIFSSYSLKTIVLQMIKDQNQNIWDEHYLDKIFAICLQQMRNPMYAIATNCWKLDSTRNEYEISEEVVRRFVLGIEGGIKDFFVIDMNHTLGGEVTFIASATGAFGFGSKINRLHDNKLTKDDWNKYFKVDVLTLESQAKLIREKLKEQTKPNLFLEILSNGIDVLMEFHTTNPNHRLARNDVNCRCVACERDQDNPSFIMKRIEKMFWPI